MTLLSIIIPISAFDERHARCHELILSAIRNKCEVILVVDAETPDAQQSIARNFSDINDVNFRIVSGYFNNPGAARNFGLTKASYEWITFWDSDDFAHVDSIIQDIVEHGSDYDVLNNTIHMGKITEVFHDQSFAPSRHRVRRHPRACVWQCPRIHAGAAQNRQPIPRADRLYPSSRNATV